MITTTIPIPHFCRHPTLANQDRPPTSGQHSQDPSPSLFPNSLSPFTLNPNTLSPSPQTPSPSSPLIPTPPSKKSPLSGATVSNSKQGSRVTPHISRYVPGNPPTTHVPRPPRNPPTTPVPEPPQQQEIPYIVSNQNKIANQWKKISDFFEKKTEEKNRLLSGQPLKQ